MTKSKNKTFCILPWVHFHVNTRGIATSCCLSTLAYGDIKKQSILEVWNEKSIHDFRLKMRSGEKENRCQICYEREKNGLRSMRQISNDKYPDLVAKLLKGGATNDAWQMPKYIDIRFSNICNFRCRTCWHGSSSKWFEEAKILKNTAGDTALIKSSQEPARFYQEVENLSDHLDEIYFAGGEPLLMEEHFQLIQHLSRKKHFHVKLRYNTNLSLIVYKGYDLTDLWKNFQDITFQVSIDGYGKRGEYIRKDLKWEKLIQHIMLLRANCPNAKLILNPTVSIYNLHHLPDLHKLCVSNGYMHIYDIELNLLHRPIYLNIKTLPIKFKEKVINLYREHIQWIKAKPTSLESEDERAKQASNQFENILNYLLSGDYSQNLSKFYAYNNRLDRLRNESFFHIFPELKSVLSTK